MLKGGSGQDYATSLASDAQGNTYVVGLTYSPDFPVTPGAAQTKFGQTSDAFIAKLGPDGRSIWATYLGGILDDWATGVALDGAGNVWITGYTRSANFPLLNPIQKSLDNGASDDYDAFVAKFSPDGKLLYSTFLGGANDDGGVGIAVDSAGNAYIAATTNSAAGFPGNASAPDQFGIVVTKLSPQGAVVYSFFHPNGTAAAIALDASGSVYVTGSCSSLTPCDAATTFGPPGSAQAIVFKISPDGSQKTYETTLGGSAQANGMGIAVNNAGEAYIGGVTTSADFPLFHPLQSSSGARPLWKSANGGAAWTPLDNLPFALPQVLVADPATPATLYEATGDLGVFKSVDAGATWTQGNTGINGTNMSSLVIDPVHTQTLYAAVEGANANTLSEVYKSVDGAGHWTLIDSSAPLNPQLAVDAQNPNIVWEISASLRTSTDGGATWKAVAFPGTVQTMVLDPRVSGHLIAISEMVFCGFFCGNNQPAYLYRSVDGGATWIKIPNVSPQSSLVVDTSTNPSTVYDGLSYRSPDGGVTWTAINPLPGSNLSAFTVDPSGTLYAAFFKGNYVSHDRAQTWTATGSFLPPGIYPAGSTSIASLVAAGAGGTVYASTNQVATSGFVSKLSADGSNLVFSTYLRGHASMQPFVYYAAEPNAMLNQNGVNAIALDAAGNVIVAGQTRASNFPLVKPAQAASAGLSDVFVASIAPDGSRLNFSTYFGGSQDDGALAVALDPAGNIVFAGQTYSIDLPLSIALQKPCCYGDAFVTKLAPPGPPRITSVLNGASDEPGIEAGSWVAIKGVNLANTFPGRTWTAEEIVNGELPKSLDGVHVTINGKPAFVYYISPVQINVQAPTDSTVGTVTVAVNNNGALGVATAQLQAFAPALFTYLGTNYAIASRQPDYALLGDPSAIAGTVAAKPGDTIALWGTGFGATDPPVSAGTAVSGQPAVVTPPQVTVGGVLAKVISAVLSEGNAGLYQITIQLPTKMPTGAVEVTASAGGVQSPETVLFVGN